MIQMTYFNSACFLFALSVCSVFKARWNCSRCMASICATHSPQLPASLYVQLNTSEELPLCVSHFPSHIVCTPLYLVFMRNHSDMAAFWWLYPRPPLSLSLPSAAEGFFTQPRFLFIYLFRSLRGHHVPEQAVQLRLAEDSLHYDPNVYCAKFAAETGCGFKENKSPHIRSRLPESSEECGPVECQMRTRTLVFLLFQVSVQSSRQHLVMKDDILCLCFSTDSLVQSHRGIWGC